MNKEEFKMEVQIGDYVRANHWDSKMTSVKVTAFGEDNFLAVDEGGETFYEYDESSWVKDYPEQKSLEGFNRYYCVNYKDKKIESVLLVYTASKIENTYWDNELLCEYITEEEAIERGLKI